MSDDNGPALFNVPATSAISSLLLHISGAPVGTRIYPYGQRPPQKLRTAGRA
jgi:hypothetical protein